jgi:site-specific DNA recombinase
MTEGYRRAILYARVSTKEQAEGGYSLRQQLEALREWAETAGYEVLEEVADPGQSGAYLERPGLDRVRDVVAAGGVSVVAAQDRDRFAREPAYVYLLREEFALQGTKIRALNDRGDDSPEGQFMDGVLDQLAKLERAKIAERTRRGLLQKVRQGKVVRGKKAPFGFRFAEDGESLVVDEESMSVVRRIFRMIGAESATLGEIIRHLSSQGITSPTGSLWHRPTLRNLVKNDLYRPLGAAEVAREALVSPEVLSTLDPARVYGLWSFNKRRRKKWRERGEYGEYRNRYTYEERPREEWTLAPVDLSDAGLVRAHVDAARERISDNTRRPASTRLNRFWELSGGIVRCGVCGSVLSPHQVHRPSGKVDGYYRCYQRYNSGPRDCTNTCAMPAAQLEEIVWQAVFSIISDPDRLMCQWEEYIDRRRRQLRGDPQRDVRTLVERLEKLERRHSGYLDLAAEGIMGRDELRTKLAEVDEQRGELRKALREAEGSQKTVEGLEREGQMGAQLLQLVDIHLFCSGPEDRRRIYQALRLQASVDEYRTVSLSGIFSSDVYLPTLVKGPPFDLSKPVPEVPGGTRVVVTPDSPYRGM